MKKIPMLILIVISFVSFGQTKKETQDWIKEKIEMYPYIEGNRIVNSFNVEFTDDYLLIKRKFEYGSSTYIYQYLIPVKDLTKIRFEEKMDNVWLYLRIKDGENIIKHTSFTSGEIKYLSHIELLMSKSINADDLKNRLIKAFNHLIILNGGTIDEEKF